MTERIKLFDYYKTLKPKTKARALRGLLISYQFLFQKPKSRKHLVEII
jgi:hypothetical protein